MSNCARRGFCEWWSLRLMTIQQIGPFNGNKTSIRKRLFASISNWTLHSVGNNSSKVLCSSVEAISFFSFLIPPSPRFLNILLEADVVSVWGFPVMQTANRCTNTFKYYCLYVNIIARMNCSGSNYHIAERRSLRGCFDCVYFQIYTPAKFTYFRQDTNPSRSSSANIWEKTFERTFNQNWNCTVIY